MYLKREPETDDGKIKALQAAVDREEINGEEIILSAEEIAEFRLFIISYEGARFVLKQAAKDLAKSQTEYSELFKNAQMYVSHFIQVLQLTVIRNETIRLDALSDYGFESGKELELPDLSTEEAIVYWGEKIIQGEAKRLSRGGYPLYNPAIAKVKVHYELFLEVVHSSKIYKQNVARQHAILYDMQKKAENMIRDVWARVEEKYGDLPLQDLSQIFQSYKISYHYQKELF